MEQAVFAARSNSQWMYGTYYLEYAGGNDSFFKLATGPACPSWGFNTIQGEIQALESKTEQLPTTLQEKPRFIFNAFKGGASNHSLFHSLKKAQIQSKSLLQENHRLDKILEIIGGKKPCISCDRPAIEKSVWSLIDDPKKEWLCVLQGAAQRFTDAQDLELFKQALNKPLSSLLPPPLMGASKEMLLGLSQARDNLAAAQNQCIRLSKDSSIETIIPDLLYSKTLQQGVGDNFKEVNRLRLNYVIEDHSGNILFAHHDTWINLF